VVTSFMSEAGLRGTSAWCSKLGGPVMPTGSTTTLKASRGNLARCKASSTAGGKLVWAFTALSKPQTKAKQLNRLNMRRVVEVGMDMA
jgi:hypothetical protein